MSWATMKTGPPVAGADQLLGQVGLPAEPVVVLARLVGEAEPRKSKASDGRPGAASSSTRQS